MCIYIADGDQARDDQGDFDPQEYWHKAGKSGILMHFSLYVTLVLIGHQRK